MRLTRYTDYAIRVLMHLAAHDDQTVSISSATSTRSVVGKAWAVLIAIPLVRLLRRVAPTPA